MSTVTAAPGLPDAHAYGIWQSDLPVLHAWALDPDIAALGEQLARHDAVALVDRHRLFILKQLLRSTVSLPGEVWELGVYRGGTAAFIRNLLARYFAPEPPAFRMFDTFSGMPPANPAWDLHVEGDFADVSLTSVQALVGADPFLEFRPGLVPETFGGLEAATLRFAHIDLDLHASISASIKFAYPRLVTGGLLLFDDYGFATCPGARRAVDDYFLGREEPVVTLPTGQSFIIKR